MTVTSVSPSVDPASRQGRVEAVFANSAGALMPGQYVRVEISLGEVAEEVVVPDEALVEDTGGRHRVWVAVPSGGALSVEPREVELVGRSKGKAAVKGRLAPGDRVVRAPVGLVSGARVVSAADPEAMAVSHARVEVTEEGFVPATVVLAADQPTKLTFVRKTDATCGTEAEFKGLGLRADLPLNKEVVLELPPQKAGTVARYACAMDMIKGTVEFK